MGIAEGETRQQPRIRTAAGEQSAWTALVVSRPLGAGKSAPLVVLKPASTCCSEQPAPKCPLRYHRDKTAAPRSLAVQGPRAARQARCRLHHGDAPGQQRKLLDLFLLLPVLPPFELESFMRNDAEEASMEAIVCSRGRAQNRSQSGRCVWFARKRT